MPRPRFSKLSDDRRRAIFQAAGEEFRANGFHDASYNRIIERCKSSKGTFYYYFDDKADLFACTLLHALARVKMGGLWDGADDGQPFWHQVHALCTDFVWAAVRHPEAVQLAKAGGAIAHLPAVQGVFRLGIERVIVVLAIGQSHGEVRTDLDLPLQASLLMGAGEALDRHLMQRFPDLTAMTETDVHELSVLYVDTFRRLVSLPA